MKIEVFDDMIVIHSPDNSENNRFEGINLMQENDTTLNWLFHILSNGSTKIEYHNNNKEQ